MPKFITIGYGDRAGYDRTPPEIRDAAHAHDAALQKAGVLMGTAGRPVQVRNTEARHRQVDEGPYMASALPIAGFAIVDAADLTQAIEIVAQTPCAVSHGVVEIWPWETPDPGPDPGKPSVD